MTERARPREFRDVLDGAIRDEASARRYERYQRSATRGNEDRPRPLEFDESGFPVVQRSPTLAQRLARLLSPP